MRMKLFLSVMLAGAAASAAAQSAPPPDAGQGDQSAIVVTGDKGSEKGIRDFVRALTPVTSHGQISRFEHSVCPIVFGLPKHQADAVAARMRQIAQAAGIRVGGSGCSPDVVLIVTADKPALMKQLRHERGDYFGDLPRSKVADLMHQPGPAVAWQLQGPPLNARGVEVSPDFSTGLYMNRTIDAGSRITEPARPQFDSAIVVVERKSLAGLTVTQLADYAAMRAFSGADPARLNNSGAPTILRVLEAPMGTAVPITMTRWDLGFLRGLYSSPTDITGAAQRSEIAKTVGQEVHRPAEPPHRQ